MKSNLINMVLVLFVITFIAAGAVGGVYILTLEPIQKAKENKINSAIAQVMPPFESLDQKLEKEVAGGIITIYPALSQHKEVVGYAVESFSKKGFGGNIKILVGFLPDGTINNTAIVSHNETPGLGDKMDVSKSDFPLQFKGVNPKSFKIAVKKDGGDIDAITAATISSRAYADAINNAVTAFAQLTNK